MASGLCVAGLKVPGPIDVVLDGVTGCLDDDLLAACRGALAGKDKQACIEHARGFTWAGMTSQIISLHQKIKVLDESKIWTRFHGEEQAATADRSSTKSQCLLSNHPSHKGQALFDAGITIVNVAAVAGLLYASNFTLPVPLLSA